MFQVILCILGAAVGLVLMNRHKPTSTISPNKKKYASEKACCDHYEKQFEDWWSGSNPGIKARLFPRGKSAGVSITPDQFLPRSITSLPPFGGEPQYTELQPHLTKRAVTFARTHGKKDLSTLRYGTDYMFVLFGTHAGNLEHIRRKGLRLQGCERADYGCGHGIYFAQWSGVCKNTKRIGCRLGEYEFTVLREGRHQFILRKNSGVVVALVMNPKLNPKVIRGYESIFEGGQSSNWVMIPKPDCDANVLPLKMISVNTIKFANEIWKTHRSLRVCEESKKGKKTQTFRQFYSAGTFAEFRRQ